MLFHELLTSVKFVWKHIFVKGNMFCSPGLDANQTEVPFDHLRDIDSTTVHSSVSGPKFKIQVLPSKDRDLLIVMYLQYIYKYFGCGCRYFTLQQPPPNMNMIVAQVYSLCTQDTVNTDSNGGGK